MESRIKLDHNQLQIQAPTQLTSRRFVKIHIKSRNQRAKIHNLRKRLGHTIFNHKYNGVNELLNLPNLVSMAHSLQVQVHIEMILTCHLLREDLMVVSDIEAHQR